MKSKTAFKTIEEFLYQENKTFVIPNYQRGYKWAVKEKDETSVEKLINNLISADKNQQYFLQGITVVEENNEIILIDGQQRITTLYLLLWCLKKERIKNINLKYDIRKQSKEFILNLKNDSFNIYDFDKGNKSQDIFYFKKAIEQINSKIVEIKSDELRYNKFVDFLLNKVTILYIVIDQDKATKTFTMMNGSKATMLQEELVKAEMLRKISLPDFKDKQVSTSVDENFTDLKEIIAKDWETNALRSRYAREWDKWLYWWNRKDVKDFFSVEKPLGLLLDYYHYTKRTIRKTEKFTFDGFRILLAENDKSEKLKTKLVFKELRDLQKSFEDIFNDPKMHNYLKMSLLCSTGNDDKYEIIDYFIVKKHGENLTDDYAKWRLIGATHRQITKEHELRDDEVKKESRAQDVLNQLSLGFVYQNSWDLALKQLLRFNVEEDNKLHEGKGRKFDFKIYGAKSLEHIHPKSKAFHKKEIANEDEIMTIVYMDGNDKDLGLVEPKGSEWLNRDDMEPNCSEHCIGNLVLLDKNENSKFNNKPFDAKKEYYFNVDEVFKSRNLLHTISVFAKSNWEKENIQENKRKFIERFKQDYGI
ncbi:MAG TPA: DUF262 domain-containing HNH endonuclease family protein [Prolixibacteraceae bacterium]|nr:DUF262 domain-containing HNH endonuclease family protein [Prolixibacteraceae bacterium]